MKPAAPLTEAVLFQFDDGDATVYETAYPILSAAGFPATAYILKNRVGTAGHMTVAQLAELNAAGWDIGNHTGSHVNLSTLTAEQQQATIEECADYLDGLGLTRASHHVAYPFGGYNADTLAAMAAAGMETGRTVSDTDLVCPIATPYELTGAIALKPTTSLWSAENRTDAGLADEIVIYYGHVVDADGGENTWTTADFQALVDYIVASGCRVVTISQLYAYMQAGYVWP